MTRVIWAVGVAVFVLAVLAAIQVGMALPLGYDSRAYWLAARHMLDGTPIYPAQNATLGASGEFHYLPIVAAPFIAFLPLPVEVYEKVFLVIEIAIAAAVGVALIRPLPNAARPWAAAAYAFFTPMILEVTLGNLDLLSLALALLAWHWRERAGRGAVALGAAVGIKFLPAILLPFYLAAGRRAIVVRALVIGLVVLAVSLPLLWVPTLDFIDLVPRYADTAWVRIIVAREEPALLADIMWSDVFPIVLGLAAVAFAVVCGRMAKKDPERETDWHHLALAASPYLAPFGFVWTTFLITSLPLLAVSFGRALRLRGALRVASLAGLLLCWVAMQVVRLHDLMPLVAHLAGVLGLIGISLALLSLERRPQTEGRSMPASRATRIASG
jgi:hypothetical protein